MATGQTSYLVTRGTEQAGPYTVGQIKSMWDNGVLTADSLAWNEASQGWIPVSNLTEEVGKMDLPLQVPPAQKLISLDELEKNSSDQETKPPGKMVKAAGGSMVTTAVLVLIYHLHGCMNEASEKRQAEIKARSHAKSVRRPH